MIVGLFNNIGNACSSKNNTGSGLRKTSISMRSQPSKDVFVPSFKGIDEYGQTVELNIGKVIKLNDTMQQMPFKCETVEERCRYLMGEVEEFNEAHKYGTRKEQEEEFGDILFNALVLAVDTNISPKESLDSNMKKISQRLQVMEHLSDKPIKDLSTEECKFLWQKAKRVLSNQETLH